MPNGSYNLRTVLQDCADAIREKLNYTKDVYPIKPTEFAEEILNFPQGSGGGTYVDPAPIVEGTISWVSNNATYVKSYTFADCSLLSQAIFPECTSMGFSAFTRCELLTDISFPKLTSVCENTFSGCTQLKEIDLPVCSTISGSAFYNCYNLSRISLPQVTTIEYAYAFGNCSALTSLYLPECSSIATSTFQGCTLLSTISLPECSYIGYSAFADCLKLSSIYIPKVSEIAQRTFYYSSNGFTPERIAILDLPECRSIGGYAFTRRNQNVILGFDSISLPKCEVLDPEALGPGCHTMSSIYLPVAYRVETCFNSCPNLTTVNLPEVTQLNGTFAFCSQLEHLNIPKLHFLGMSVFTNCTKLSTLPSWPLLSTIGIYCFNSCTGLSKVEFTGVQTISSSAFQDCSFSEVSFPNATVIYSSAFYNCKNLSKTNFENVVRINQGAFAYCSSLTELYLPKISVIYTYSYNVPNYSRGVFESCTNLSKIILFTPNCNFGNENKSVQTFSKVFKSTPMMDSSYLGYYGSIYVPSAFISYYKTDSQWSAGWDRIAPLDSSYEALYIFPEEFKNSTITEIPVSKQAVESVYYSGCVNCASLSQVYLPSCVTIGSFAFMSCSSLTQVSLPECTNIGSKAFSYCSNLSSIFLPKVEEIGSYAFMNCYNLAQVDLPECSSIAYEAFIGCSNLQVISLPKCKELYGGVFNGCSKITTVSLPEVELFYENFSNCASLTSISLPKATLISGLSGCAKLSQLYAPLCETVGWSTARSCYSLSAISFPVASIVYNYAFQSCTGLRKAILPNCETIGYGAFSYCTKLSIINLPNIKTLEGYAFHKAVPDLTQPETNINFENIISIGNYVFTEGIRGLINLDLKSCWAVGSFAFKNCYDLTWLSIAGGSYYNSYQDDYLTTILWGGAFTNCNNLSVVYLNNYPLLYDMYQFSGCHSLKSVYIYSPSIPNQNSYDEGYYPRQFEDTPMDNSRLIGTYGSIYVRASLVSYYKKSPIWSAYKNRFVGLTQQELDDIFYPSEHE